MKIFYLFALCFFTISVYSQNTQIRYNQVGYLMDQSKKINLTSSTPFQGLAYEIEDMNGDVVKSGVSTQSKLWEYSKEYVSIIDFSDLNQIGDFTIKIGSAQKNIKIKENSYDLLSKASLKYFYFNRASMAIDQNYAGIYKRPLGHPDTEVFVHSSAASSARPTGTKISCPRGWYDAGDYNKYIVNSGISTYSLIAAYEHFPQYFDTLSLDIPEAGGVLPDILDEVKWNLDWMETMQDPNDGGVYHKCTDLNFNGENMPHQYTAKRFVVAKSTAATLNFAAVMAIASRVYKKFDANLGDKYLNAAIKAYAWAKLNPTVYYKQPADVKTGEYGDGNVIDEFQWAASELFISSGKLEYKKDINANTIGNGVPAWPYTSPLALISLIYHQSSLTNDFDFSVINSKLISTADKLLATLDKSAMNVAMGNEAGDYVWGSNAQACNQILILIRAYESTSNKAYLDGAFSAFDYIVGRNATGYCFVTGFGDRSPLKPHHRISQADGIAPPVPGMLAGGPHSGKQDNCAGYPSSNPASCFLDAWCSYSTNEVAINWNAPLAYVVNALSFYQKKNIISSLTTNDKFSGIRIFPNPTSDELSIYTSLPNFSYTIIDATGHELKKGNGHSNTRINIDALQKGLYYVRFSYNGQEKVEKFFKP